MHAPFARFPLVAVLLVVSVACTPATGPSPTPAPAKPGAARPAPTAAPGKPAEKPAAKSLDFTGKTITLLVNFSAGGPTDLFGRLLAQHLDRHIPGRPTIIVQNMPGAGGIVGENYVYNAAKNDGLTIGVFSSPFADQIFGADNVQFDTTKFLWLGGVHETSVGFAHKSLGVKTAQELPGTSQQIVLGGLAPDSASDLTQRTFLNLLGAKYKYVTGYPGQADVRAAFLRGEVNFSMESLNSFFPNITPLVDDGTAVVMGQRGILKNGQVAHDSRVKDIPTYSEIALQVKGDEVKKTVEYRSLTALVGMSSTLIRAIVYPPGVDQALVEVMREAVADTFADKEFQTAAEKQIRYQFEFSPGAEAQELAKEVIADGTEDKEVLESLKKLAREKG